MQLSSNNTGFNSNNYHNISFQKLVIKIKKVAGLGKEAVDAVIIAKPELEEISKNVKLTLTDDDGLIECIANKNTFFRSLLINDDKYIATGSTKKFSAEAIVSTAKEAISECENKLTAYANTKALIKEMKTRLKQK